ncbi:MAG TPA: aldose epimerase family protein [Gemmatimonadaceae bacterium]|nr:aldose epimerase family protein [Gemmatimonadaceae bacterium]
MEERPFGALPDGRPVQAFVLRNGDVEVEAITYGAIITRVLAPDRRGEPGDVVLGFDTLDEYLEHSPYFGAVVGRYANRIAHGRFALDGVTYQLACNDGANHLHGGVRGFDKVLWTATPLSDDAMPGVTFLYDSADGDEGYPGTLSARVTYRLSGDGALHVRYHATTDRATIVNLTQHSYFNLAAGEGNVLGHQVVVNASRFTPVDAGLIPTGELRLVEGTPFDFRTPAALGARIDEPDGQLETAGGYDHNFVLDSVGDRALVLAARVVEPMSGRTLELRTTEPGLQLYSGNFLDGSIIGKGGRRYAHRSGFCLETQHFPDSPNHPEFPSAVLRPDGQYESESVFVFGVT